MSSPAGQKRDRSPSNLVAPDILIVQTKKSKGEHINEPTSSQVDRAEMKKSELPATPGNNDPNLLRDPLPHTEDLGTSRVCAKQRTSEHPHPGSSTEGDRVPPLWAQESCSLLKSIWEELRELKNAVVHVQEKVNNVNKHELYELRNAVINIHRKIDAHHRNPPIDLPKPSDVPIPDISEPVLHDAADVVSVEMNNPAPSSPLLSPPPHADYMENCFRSRTSLDPTTRVEVSISTFDGVIVAKGYNRVIISQMIRWNILRSCTFSAKRK